LARACAFFHPLGSIGKTTVRWLRFINSLAVVSLDKLMGQVEYFCRIPMN